MLLLVHKMFTTRKDSREDCHAYNVVPLVRFFFLLLPSPPFSFSALFLHSIGIYFFLLCKTHFLSAFLLPAIVPPHESYVLESHYLLTLHDLPFTFFSPGSLDASNFPPSLVPQQFLLPSYSLRAVGKRKMSSTVLVWHRDGFFDDLEEIKREKTEEKTLGKHFMQLCSVFVWWTIFLLFHVNRFGPASLVDCTCARSLTALTFSLCQNYFDLFFFESSLNYLEALESSFFKVMLKVTVSISEIKSSRASKEDGWTRNIFLLPIYPIKCLYMYVTFLLQREQRKASSFSLFDTTLADSLLTHPVNTLHSSF